MPTLFIIFGLRFYFYFDEHLPIHVRNTDGEAKFEVDPVKLVSNRAVKKKDISLAEALIEENKQIIIHKWHEYHGK